MNKFEKIAARYLPRGYTVEYRKGRGMHYGGRQLIRTPRPVTVKSLYMFLHECAHAYLHTGSGRRQSPRHVQEMEAELWAHAKMRENGIEVPVEITERAKRYVAFKIMQAERRGAKNIDPRARSFAGERVKEMHDRWEAALGKSRHPNARAAEEGER
jgi:hypothetical protein